jgi:hypothetical protein
MSYYSRTNNSAASLRIDMGSLKSGPDSYTDLDLGNSGGWYFRFNNSVTYNFVSATDTSGFFNGNRTASNVINFFRNGTKAVTGTAPSNATSSTNYFIGASNNHAGGSTDTPQYFSNRECAFSSIGDGLTDTEALVFNQIVEGYQYELSRNINPVNANYYNTAYNNETNAFLYSSQITDNTQKTAVNTLVNDLKTAGVWTKMKAVYPFIGGTASTHKWNLINPQDTDAAFRLVFNGGWTHSTTGALPNGTNGYADTKCNMSTNYSVNTSVHISYYSRTDGSFTSQDMAVYNGTTFTALTIRRSVFSNQTLFAANETINYSFSATDPNGAAFYISNRTALNINNGWRNSTKVATGTNTAGTRPSLNMFLANMNVNGSPDAGLYGKRECAFSSIGDGLTDTEAANFYTAVQNFNTTLSRQV